MPLEIFGPEKMKNMCLVIAGQHGTEVEGTILISSVLRSISEKSLMCAVMPSINPDGLARGTRCNAAGVDLNRNFPTRDWTEDPVFYSWNNDNPQDTELGSGKYAASEPETEALLNILEDIKPAVIISIHAPMGCIDDPLTSNLSQWISGETGLPLVTDIGYPTPGSFGTWALERGINLITFELPSDSIQNHRRKFTPVLAKILTGGYREFM